MNKLYLVTIIALGILGGTYLLTGQTSPQASSELTFSTIRQNVHNGARLYDVRTSEEYASGHFDGATNWPIEDITAGKLPDVDKATKLYVYCRSGNRSAQAASALKTAGYTNVTDLGGLSEVQAIGGTLMTMDQHS